MSNRRAIFWLFLLTLLCLGVNFALSFYAPVVKGAASGELLDPGFAPTEIRLSPATVLSRTDGRWRLVSPFAAAVDAQVVLRLVDRFSTAPVEAVLSEAELLRAGRTRADFGLDGSSSRITFRNATDERSVSFGAFAPASNGVYAAVSGVQAVFIVSNDLRAAASLPADAFRERHVFPFDPGFITGVDLRRAETTTLSLLRKGETWTADGAVVSSARVNGFLALLSDAVALDFVWPVGVTNDTDLASASRLSGYGLDADSALTVDLHCLDGVDRRIALGREADEEKAYALIHNGSAIVTLDRRVKAAVQQGFSGFVDERLFPLEESAVSSYTISDAIASYVVARAEDGSWRLDAPVAAPADSETAVAILARILALTGADRAAEGLRVSVVTNLEPVVVASSALLEGRRLEDLRSRDILRIDPTLVRRLVTSGADAEHPVRSVIYSRERRAWNVESEGLSDAVVDEEGVAAVLSAVSPLRAERVVSLKATPAELARYGLEVPFRTVAIDQEVEGALRRNILIGGATAGGRYATVGTSEAVFVLSDETVSSLLTPIVK